MPLCNLGGIEINIVLSLVLKFYGDGDINTNIINLINKPKLNINRMFICRSYLTVVINHSVKQKYVL